MADNMPMFAEINLDELLNNSMMDESLFQYYKSRFTDRTLIFNAEVDDDIVEKIIIPLYEMDHDGTKEKITLILNSGGGEVYNGMVLCHAIDRIENCELEVKIMSMAASMGAYIAMAGYSNPNVWTTCTPYTVFLLHSGYIGVDGTSNAVRDTIRFQENYEDILTEYILTHSDIPKEEYEAKFRHEWWMTAEDALKYGIVDEIV